MDYFCSRVSFPFTLVLLSSACSSPFTHIASPLETPNRRHKTIFAIFSPVPLSISPFPSPPHKTLRFDPLTRRRSPSSRTPRHPLLTNQPKPTEQHKRRQRPKDNSQRNKRANNTSNRRRNAVSIALIRLRVSSTITIAAVTIVIARSTQPRAIPALGTPLLRGRDRELRQISLKRIPRETSLAAAEKRIRGRFARVARRAVVEEEPYLQAIRRVRESR